MEPWPMITKSWRMEWKHERLVGHVVKMLSYEKRAVTDGTMPTLIMG